MAEDSKKAGRKGEECIDGLERLKEAVDEIQEALDRQDKDLYARQLLRDSVDAYAYAAVEISKAKIKPGTVFRKAKVIDNLNAPRVGVYCRCNPAPWYTPRHSGRYPWPGIKPLHLPTREPSPGFIFANKNWIKHNMSFTVSWANDSKKYMVKDGELTVCKEFPYRDLEQMIRELDSIDAFEDYIVSDLAHEYDKIMIREVFNMDSNRLNRFVTLLNAVGGNFRIDQSVCERATAHINIPCDMLHHLHIDGDGSIVTQAFNGVCIPGISNIQTFNDRAVQITFVDGTQTKSVCGKDEAFDLYEGIAFCLFKRFLGKDGHKGFNDMMRYAFKKLDEQEKAKAREAEIEAEKKRREEKKKLQAERRKARKREEQIDVYQEAMKRDREAMLADGWVTRPISYPVADPNLCIAPGEPKPPVKSDKKATDDSTLFLDPLSGETFISSKDKILLAMVTLNKRILEHGWVSVNEWYEELGLDSSGNLGESMGWTPDHLMRIDFADYITRDGRECYAIVYDEKPVGYREG